MGVQASAGQGLRGPQDAQLGSLRSDAASPGKTLEITRSQPDPWGWAGLATAGAGVPVPARSTWSALLLLRGHLVLSGDLLPALGEGMGTLALLVDVTLGSSGGLEGSLQLVWSPPPQASEPLQILLDSSVWFKPASACSCDSPVISAGRNMGLVSWWHCWDSVVQCSRAPGGASGLAPCGAEVKCNGSARRVSSLAGCWVVGVGGWTVEQSVRR